MNETHLGNTVREVLERELDHLDADTTRRLKAARLRALEHQRTQPSPVLAWADNVLGWRWERASPWRLVLPLALLVASGAGLYGWQHRQHAADLEEIDAQLLTDELPLDAYLDRGFQAWLKQREAQE